jgi:tetratricopeptide (TPR) repeat protein
MEEPRNAAARRQVIVSLNNLGLALKAKGDLVAAGSRLEEAVSVARDTSAQNPGNHQLENDLVNVLVAAGELRAERRDQNSAQKLLEEAVSISRTSASRDPEDVPAGLQLVDHLQALAEIRGQLGDMSAVVKLAQEALDTCRLLSERYSGNPFLKRRVAGSLANLGNVHRRMGDIAIARQRLNEARAMMAELRTVDPGNREYAADVIVFDELLVALDHAAANRRASPR